MDFKRDQDNFFNQTLVKKKRKKKRETERRCISLSIATARVFYSSLIGWFHPLICALIIFFIS